MNALRWPKRIYNQGSDSSEKTVVTMDKLHLFTSLIERRHRVIGIGLFVTAIAVSVKHYPQFGIPYDSAFYIIFTRNLSENIADFSYQGI